MTKKKKDKQAKSWLSIKQKQNETAAAAAAVISFSHTRTHLDFHVDAHGAFSAGLHNASVVYLKVVAHHDVLQVRRGLQHETVLVVQATAAFAI